MKYLIDTQILIWYQLDNPQLSKATGKLLLDVSNEVFVTQVTLFEIAIKQRIEKLPELDVSINQLLRLIDKDGFQILPIKNEHIACYEQIPLLPEHRDPFDRLILATAFSENMPIISADAKFKFYHPLIQLIEN